MMVVNSMKDGKAWFCTQHAGPYMHCVHRGDVAFLQQSQWEDGVSIMEYRDSGNTSEHHDVPPACAIHVWNELMERLGAGDAAKPHPNAGAAWWHLRDDCPKAGSDPTLDPNWKRI